MRLKRFHRDFGKIYALELLFDFVKFAVNPNIE